MANKNKIIIMVVAIIMLNSLLLVINQDIAAAEIIEIPDANLKEMLVEVIDSNGDGEISVGEAEEVTNLGFLSGKIVNSVTGGYINDITGIEYFTNLAQLELQNNQIKDISPLLNLPLDQLNLHGNQIKDISPLLNLPLVKNEPPYLFLSGNPIYGYDGNELPGITMKLGEIDDFFSYRGDYPSFPVYVLVGYIIDSNKMNETELDQADLTLELGSTTFADNNLAAENFVLENAPPGLTIDKIEYIDNKRVKLSFAFDNSDIDDNNLKIKILGAELSDSSRNLVFDNLPLITNNDGETINLNHDGNFIEGQEDGEVLTVDIYGGEFATVINPSNWTINNLPLGVTKGSVNRIDGTTVEITLSGNSTGNYNLNTQDLEVSCTVDQYVDSTGGMTLTARLNDTTAPQISSLNPAAGADTQIKDDQLTITFDENIFIDEGEIRIYQAADDSLVESINVSGNKVTGEFTKNITIAPANLEGGTEYYLQIDDSCFRDVKGNNFAGIVDKRSWKFTTLIHFSSQTLKEKLIDSAFADNNEDGEISISEAEAVTEIQYNAFRGEGIQNISGLEHFTSLNGFLYLYNNNISDISPLSSLTSLTGLTLTRNNVSDLSPLSRLNSLTELELDFNNISNLAPLSNLDNLTYLNLKENNINGDLDELSSLNNLTELSIDVNDINNIEGLSSATKLTKVRMKDNNIEDISTLSNLTNLEVLWSGINNISDLSALSDLNNLKELRLSQNNISNLSPLSNLTALEKLYLYDNNISDISVLSNLTSLNDVDLRKNNIKDIRPLSQLLSSCDVYVRENPMFDDTANNAISLGTLEFPYLTTEVWVPAGYVRDFIRLTESELDNASIELELYPTTFIDSNPEPANFVLNNFPEGVSIESIDYITNNQCKVNLAFDGTDFTEDYTDLELIIKSSELAMDSFGYTYDQGLTFKDDMPDIGATETPPEISGVSFEDGDGIINKAEESNLTISFTQAEVNTTYEYIMTDSGGEQISGIGTVTTSDQIITGLDVRGLCDGELTLSVVLTDNVDKESSMVTDTIEKDTVKPTLTDVNISSDNDNDTTVAKVGDTITLDITASEDITEPDVSIAGKEVTVTDADDSDNSTWQAEYTMTADDNQGDVSFSINNHQDTAGNTGTEVTQTTDDTSVEFSKTAPAGYSIDPESIKYDKVTGLSFNITGADIGSSCSFSLQDEAGGEISGSKEIETKTQTITIAESDLAELEAGSWTIEIQLTDKAGNLGEKADHTIEKPEIRVELTADFEGDSLNPGEEITYRLKIENTGDGVLKETEVYAPIPAGSEYIADSTVINGKKIADLNNSIPLLESFKLSSLENEDGSLEAGENIIITYQVKTMTGLISGSKITNQAEVSGEDAVSYPSAAKLSDDPRTAELEDPLKLVLGDSVLLEIDKEITKEDKSNLQIAPGDILEISTVIKNIGGEAAFKVSLNDLIPENTELIEESIEIIDKSSLSENSLGTKILEFALHSYFNNRVIAAENPYQIVDNKIIFNLGDLEAGAEIEIRYQVQVNGEADDGEIISSESNLSSENSSPIKESKDVTVGDSPVIRAGIEVNDINGGEIKVGDSLEYIFTAENIANSPAYNLRLESIKPEALSYINDSIKINGRKAEDTDENSQIFDGVTFEEIAPGEKKEIRYRAEVNSAEKIKVKMTYAAAAEKKANSQLNTKAESYDPLSGTVEKSITVGVLNSQADIKFNLSSSIFSDFNGWYLDIRAENGQKIHTDFKINNSAESEELSLPSAERNYTALIKNQNKTVFAEVEINAGEIADGDLTIKTADIDPEGIVYDSFTREAAAGARLYLLDEAGNKVDADLLEAGQQGQITDESGSYQFIVKEEGKYQIAVEKDGYAQTPSLELAPKSDSYIRPEEITDADSSDPDIQVVDYSRAPEKNEEAVYYLKFDLQSGDPDVLNNHLPIDPLQENLLEISKTAAEKQTAVGEFISYQITVENDGENDVKDFELHDKLPNLFKYTADSAIIERGETKELFEAGGERLLSWDISELKAGESFKLSYTLVVGSGAQSGIEYTNQAYLKKGNTIISDTAEAKVLVTKDAVLDLSTLIGKVYFDQNENGIQDKGEKGIAGVEIISISGERITVDDQGRFHLVTAADSMTAVGETIVLKLKEDTLPDGAEVISDSPLIIKVKPGLMRKANFRLKLKE